jgi:citrate lyase beta subunit
MASQPHSAEEHILVLSPAFGYMRIERGASPDESDRLRQEMADFAVQQGFTLREIFVELEDSVHSSFAILIDALRDSNVTVVVVPSMHHFARMESVRAAMKDRIERETGARILATRTDKPDASPHGRWEEVTGDG